MFVRQELTKEYFQSALKLDVIFRRSYLKIISLIKNAISYIFPLYYEKIDTFDEIYDYYQTMSTSGKDY
jgi:hypothetical protein